MPRQDGGHFPDDVFKRIFFNKYILIAIKISLKFVPKGQINNITTLVRIMAWRRPSDKPLSEPMVVSLLTHICVTRPQWVKLYPVEFHWLSIILCNYIRPDDIIQKGFWQHFDCTLQWRHNEHDGIWNHRRPDCLLNHLFRHRSKKTSKLRITGHYKGNSPVTSDFPHKGPVMRKIFPFDDVIMMKLLLDVCLCIDPYILSLFSRWAVISGPSMDNTTCMRLVMSTVLLQQYSYKQRVLMHRHQRWNVRHGLCHIYMRYIYIYMSCL